MHTIYHACIYHFRCLAMSARPRGPGKYIGGDDPRLPCTCTVLAEEEMSRFTRVKRSQSTRLPHDFDDREDIFLDGMESGRATTLGGAAAGTATVSAQRRIHSGTLQKRCRVSRYIIAAH